MTKHYFYSGNDDREAELIPIERCSTCERWKRIQNWRAGSCGKRGYRTDENDWCRFHTKNGVGAALVVKTS